MTKRHNREYWQRDDHDQRRHELHSPSRDERDRNYQGSWQAHDRSHPRDDHWRGDPRRRDDQRWREDRWTGDDRGYHPDQSHHMSERQYGQGEDYRSGQGYRTHEDYGWGSDHRSNQYGNLQGSERNQDYRRDYRTQDYGSGSYGSGSYREQGNQIPYAGSGEPRWGETRGSEAFRRDYGDWDTGRGWERSRSRGYEAHTGFPYVNYGSYGSSGERSSGGFFGKGPKGYTRSDDRIREDVCDRLSYDDELDASDITVSVADGEVTLEGTVPDRRSKHRAEDISDAVHGVRDVHNRLKARKGLMQEVGDRLMGREEEEHGHAGSGTRNSPSGASQTGTSSTSSTSSTGSAISPSVMTSGAVRNGR
jgi:osmotically-inducible protein OsmY